MDKLKQLYESYISQGIITSAVSFEKFSSSSKDARSKLYKAGVDKNLFKKTTEEQFNSAWQVDEPKPAKTKAVATDPAPVTAVKKADTDSTLESGSSALQKSDNNVETAMFNYEARTGSKANSVMDLTDEDYEEGAFLKKFKQPKAVDIFKANRDKIKSLEDKRKELEKKATTYSYNNFGATQESVDYIEEQLKDFDNLVLEPEVRLMESNPEFKLQNQAIAQLSKDTGNNQATGDSVDDLASEFSILNTFRGKSYYKNIEADETIKLNEDVEAAVVGELSQRSLEKLAGGFYTLQEKENLIKSVKIPLIKQRSKEVTSKIEQQKTIVESEVESQLSTETKIRKSLKALDKTNPKEIAEYNLLVNTYNKSKEKLKSKIENFESSRKKLISEYDSYQGELGVDYANNVIRNSFEISNDVDAFREKYAGEGFWNGTADIVGGDIIQGLYQTVKKATVGSGSWILTSFSDAFQDQESYSSYDAFSDVVNNWSTKTLVPSSTDEKFSITKEEGGFKDAKDLSTRNFLKLGGSMVPFTTYLISEVRKGNYKGVKQALGDTYLKFGNKGKVLKDASQQLKNNIIMADATFRATIMDNQKVAESKGLNGIQASAYATAISTTEAAVQSIMPDSNFLKGIEGKAIKDAFIGSLKKVATKEGAKAASKEFVVNLGKELLEEEANFAGNLLTDISFGLALPKSSEFLNQQIDLVTGTLMLSSGMGSIGAVKTFNNQKTLIYSQINKNLGSLELQLTEMHSKVSDEDTKDQIYNAIVFARDISKAIDKSPKNVTADQIDLLVKKQKLIDTKKEKDLVFHEEINNKIASIDSRIKESAVKRDVISKVDKDIANIDKSMASSGFEIEKTIVLDDDANSTSSEKFYDILVKGSKPKGFKGTIEDFANANKNNLGGFITDAKGNETLVINRAEAINKSVITTGQHEFLHKLLRYTFDKSSIKQAASLLESMVDKMPKDQGVEYKNRLEVYKKDLESGALTADAFYEEYLTLLSEAITNEDVSTDKSIIGKVKDFFRRKGEDQGLNIDFKKGEEGVINFVKDYNRAFAKGKFNKQKQTTKNVKANTFSASKVADIEGKIEALQDKYDDGLLDYDDYEQQLDNLESKLEKAKSAPVEEKVVSKPKTKEVKENTEEVIKKASDKVFKGDEVSDRNKGISKINEDIANEMLELGANSISDIKDPAKRKAIVDKLGKNNLGAVTNLTKKAAAVGKDLAIDSNLKVGYDEFFSGFSEELSALIQTYKVKVDGKKVPFGAYMNKNLSLRYGQILDKALKGRVQNAQSLDVESGSVGSVKEIAAEGSRDFDAYTSADKGLPAGELIDVTKFKNVKDRVEAVKDVINLEGVDVADLTYKKVVDDYAGVTGAEVIGLHDKNAEPEKGQDKNDFQKLAERIDGTRTLNYGKGVNGEAEVRAMQKLFIDYNDMVKFIKTIPEFNVAPFETTIDKQGRSIDLTADAKGYSVGTSNVLLKELYDIYIDPKSKSADKATKTRSITSPSGRGKGKTSQVAKVYRLKDKLRGRIDRKTVKELQKTIGITEAGEAFIPMKGVNRTKFGTALQGLTKIYAANVANTVIRKDIVDKGITSDKKPTEKVLADIGGGKSSVMFSRAVDLGLETPFETPMLGQVLFSKKARAEYESVLKNKRPDLEDPSKQVDNLIKWGDSLDIPDNQKTKYKKLGLYYMANGYVIMPEDGYKVTEAIRLGKANKVDPYSVKNPNELIEKYQAKTKGDRLNPDKVEQFSNKTVLKEGVVVYDVESSKKGQLAVRKAIDTNWGEKANPWCLAARAKSISESTKADTLDLAKAIVSEFEIDGYTAKINKEGDTYYIDAEKKIGKEEALDKAFGLWESYNEEGGGYKIAFKNGKLMSLRDGNDMEWWDRMDAPFSSIPLKSTTKKEGSQKVTEHRQMDAVTGESYVGERKIERPTENGYIKEIYRQSYKTKKLVLSQKSETEIIEESIKKTTEIEYDSGFEIDKTTTTVNEDRNTYISVVEDKVYSEEGNLDVYYKNTVIKGNKFLEKTIQEFRNGKLVRLVEAIKTVESYKKDDLNVVYSNVEKNGKVVENIDNRKEFGFEEGEGEYSVLFSKNTNTDLMFNAEDKIPADRNKEFKSLKNKPGVKTLDVFYYIDKIPSKDFKGGLKEKRAAMFDVVSDITTREGVDAGSIALNELKKVRSVFKYEYVSAGFLNAMVDLKSKVKNSTPVEGEKLVLDFLRFISRSARTSKGKNLQYISTNKKIFNEAIINVLGKKNNFSLEQVKITEKGKPKYVNVIYFKTKRLTSFTDITFIKKDGFSGKINEEADMARTVVLNTIDTLKRRLKTDPKFTKEMFDTQLESFLSLASLDQRGLIRKMSKTNAQIEPGFLKATDLYLEHKMSALEITEKLKEYANDEINIEELQKILKEEALVNLMPKSLAEALPNFKKERSKNPKYKNADGYKTDKYQKELNKFKDKIVDIDGNDQANKGGVFFSKGLSSTFNKIIENKTGIKADDTISEVKAKMLADSKRRFNIFIPPSAEDFVGLLYATLGKGKVGDKQMKFYDRTLLKPYARAMQAVTRDRLDLGRSFKRIKKEFNTTPKDLKKKVPGSLFDKEQAVRIYIWDSIGKEVPGLSVEEVNELANYVANNEKLKEFAEQVMRLNPGSRYLSPKEGWETSTITTDLLETLNESRRAKHLERWQQNVDDIFSNENLNKLEAAYGTSYRKSVENILTRMKTGRNRTYGTDSQTAAWIEWMNGSVGTIMFFNTRSAILQTLSATNFINFSDNNVFAAGKAFANQKQYWSDFTKLMNSEYLLERRDSLKINVNEADIADAARQKGARGAINYLLKLGFTPTKFADSFAIASGGATFYRNRLNALIKKGMDPVAAEKAAMRDFIETAEESQQSSRPDKISQEQAGPLGRLVLAFANTPAQYARIIKKAASDLKNGRGDAKTNISKIMYYGVLQNVIFNALQQALFAIAFGDEEDEEMLDDKKLNIANGMLDSFIRGTGILGAVFTMVKNTGIKLYKESEKRNPKYGETAVFEALKISPPISSKATRMRAAGRTLSWEMDEIKEKGVDITNPAVGASASVISALTNIPLDRVVRKVENLSAASDSELETYKRLALTLGWGKWELGIKDPKKKKKKKKSSGIKGYKIKNYKIKF